LPFAACGIPETKNSPSPRWMTVFAIASRDDKAAIELFRTSVGTPASQLSFARQAFVPLVDGTCTEQHGPK
jgi:hypothetical protein